MNEGKFHCCHTSLCYYKDIRAEVFDETTNGFDFVATCIFIILLLNTGQLSVISTYARPVSNFKSAMCDARDCLDAKYYQV